MKPDLSSAQQVTEFESNRRPLYEMLTIVALMVISVIFIPAIQQLMAIVPIVYFLVERGVRKRSGYEVGFRPKEFLEGVKKSWIYIFLVVVVSQVLFLLIAKTWLPEVVVHLIERTPVNLAKIDTTLLLGLVVLPLGEEMAFRGLIQERLTWIMRPTVAIIITSLVFALMHFAPGDPLIVSYDLAGVFIDSVLFGIIFMKTKNLLVSWAAHSLADIVGVLLMGWIF